MTTYTITITEQQGYVLSAACEVLARLGTGQYDDALRRLPQREDIDWSTWHDDVRAIGQMLSRHMANGIDGYRASLGINHAKTSKESKVAWDLYQVIRHRLAWDRAIAEGITDGTTRDWSKMMGVHYDAPMRASTEPLATMEQAA